MSMAAGSSLRSPAGAAGDEMVLFSSLAEQVKKVPEGLVGVDRERLKEREGHVIQIIYRNKMQNQKKEYRSMKPFSQL